MMDPQYKPYHTRGLTHDLLLILEFANPAIKRGNRESASRGSDEGLDTEFRWQGYRALRAKILFVVFKTRDRSENTVFEKHW